MWVYVLIILWILFWWTFLMLFSAPDFWVLYQDLTNRNFYNFANYVLEKQYVSNKDNWVVVTFDSNWNIQDAQTTQYQNWYYKFWRLIDKNKDTVLIKFLWDCRWEQSCLSEMYKESWWSNDILWWIPIFYWSDVENAKSDWHWILMKIRSEGDWLYKISYIKIFKNQDWVYKEKEFYYFYK